MVKNGALLITSLTLPLLLSGIAAAAPDCTIYQTGSDSYNACVANNKNEAYVTCTNNVYTLYTNTQASSSGNAKSSGNTTSGNTSTGTAINSNNTSVTIGSSCGSPQKVTTTAPTVGKGSGTTAATPAGTSGQAATALPETGNNALTEGAIVTLISIAGLLALTKIGFSLMQRTTLR